MTAVFMLFVLYYPHQTLYFSGCSPCRRGSWDDHHWQGPTHALTGKAGNVAWQAHIGGAAFAFLYARFRWQFTRFLPALGSGVARKWPGAAPG